MPRIEFDQGTEQQNLVDGYKKALLASGAVGIAPNASELYQLRNKTYSWVYINHRAEMLGLPEYRKPFIDSMLEAVKNTFQDTQPLVFANVDSGVSPFITGGLAYLYAQSRPETKQILVYPEEISLLYRKPRRKLGIDMPHLTKDHTVLLVDDVLTPGDVTAINVYQLLKRKIWQTLRRDTRQVQFHLLVGLIRDPNAAKRLEKYGLRVHWLLTLEEVLKEASQHMDVTDEQRQGILETLGIVI